MSPTEEQVLKWLRISYWEPPSEITADNIFIVKGKEGSTQNPTGRLSSEDKGKAGPQMRPVTMRPIPPLGTSVTAGLRQGL